MDTEADPVLVLLPLLQLAALHSLLLALLEPTMAVLNNSRAMSFGSSPGTQHQRGSFPLMPGVPHGAVSGGSLHSPRSPPGGSPHKTQNEYPFDDTNLFLVK